MSAPAYKTFLGYRVWPSSMLKVYFPFMISSTTIFFLFSNVHTSLMNNPYDKWANLLEDMEADGKKTKLKNEASEYYEAHINGKTPAAKHH